MARATIKAIIAFAKLIQNSRHNPASVAHYAGQIEDAGQRALDDIAAMDGLIDAYKSRLKAIAALSGVDPDEYLDDLIEVYERAGAEAKDMEAGK